MLGFAAFVDEEWARERTVHVRTATLKQLARLARCSLINIIKRTLFVCRAARHELLLLVFS